MHITNKLWKLIIQTDTDVITIKNSIENNKSTVLLRVSTEISTNKRLCV